MASLWLLMFFTLVRSCVLLYTCLFLRFSLARLRAGAACASLTVTLLCVGTNWLCCRSGAVLCRAPPPCSMTSRAALHVGRYCRIVAAEVLAILLAGAPGSPLAGNLEVLQALSALLTLQHRFGVSSASRPPLPSLAAPSCMSSFSARNARQGSVQRCCKPECKAGRAAAHGRGLSGRGQAALVFALCSCECDRVAPLLPRHWRRRTPPWPTWRTSATRTS